MEWMKVNCKIYQISVHCFIKIMEKEILGKLKKTGGACGLYFWLHLPKHNYKILIVLCGSKD